MQQYANTYLLLNCSTSFGRPSRPSSGVHKTVVAASGTDRTIWGATLIKRDQIKTYLVTFDQACSPPHNLTCSEVNEAKRSGMRWSAV